MIKRLHKEGPIAMPAVRTAAGGQEGQLYAWLDNEGIVEWLPGVGWKLRDVSSASSAARKG